MFELSSDELAKWRSQFVTSNADRMGLRHLPMAFTEQGVAMLASVLNSARAIDVNIAIVRAFVRLREFLASQVKLAKRFRQLEQEVASHGKAIGTLFEAMQQLTRQRSPAIGFQYVDAGEDKSGEKSVHERRTRYDAAGKFTRGVIRLNATTRKTQSQTEGRDPQ